MSSTVRLARERRTESDVAIKRHFVTVGGRQVHYRRAGTGPPVVCFHAQPRSSRWLLPLVSQLDGRFTVLAFDTPGYGSSDPLPIEQPAIGDYSEAFAEAFAALGLERYSVYGFETGALIGLELTLRYPERVTGLVADGLPLFNDEERAELLEHYMPPFEPRADGAHLVALWSAVRDAFIFWPWYKHELEARLEADMPDAEELHEAVLDFLRAGTTTYRLSMVAVLHYATKAAVERLSVPSVIATRPSDVPYLQRERLPALPDCVQLADLPDSSPARERRIEGLLAMLPQEKPAPPALLAATIPGRISKDYVDTAFGQLFLRRSEDAPGRKLVMLHPSPGSAAQLEPLMGALAGSRPLLAFDTLGYGESDKPTFSEPTIADFARVVLDALDRLGLAEIDLYGESTGGLIALEVALQQPQRVHKLILDGVVLFPDAERAELLANVAPPFEPRWDGSHMVWVWSFARDLVLWFPSYRRTRGTMRRAPIPSPEALHHWVVEILKAGTTYPLAMRAVFSYPTHERLPNLQPHTLICCTPDRPLHRFLEEARQMVANATSATLSETLEEAATVLSRFLDGN